MSEGPSLAALTEALRRALARGDLDSAIRHAAEAQTRFPDAPAPLFLLCTALLDRRDPRAAALLPRLDRFPEHAEGWQALGETLLRLDRNEAALVAFDRSAAHAPPDARRAAIGRAAALEALNRPAEAADALLPALEDSAELHYRRGLLLRRADRAQAARAALDRAIALDPRRAEAHFALGLACQDAGDQPAAIAAYRAALDRRPDFHEAALNLGTALQAAGDWDAARAAYARALRLRPESFGRIAQAVTAARRGRLFLDPADLRRALAEGL